MPREGRGEEENRRPTIEPPGRAIREEESRSGSRRLLLRSARRLRRLGRRFSLLLPHIKFISNGGGGGVTRLVEGERGGARWSTRDPQSREGLKFTVVWGLNNSFLSSSSALDYIQGFTSSRHRRLHRLYRLLLHRRRLHC